MNTVPQRLLDALNWYGPAFEIKQKRCYGTTSASQRYAITVSHVAFGWYKLGLYLDEDYMDRQKLTPYHNDRFFNEEDVEKRITWLKNRLMRTPLLTYNEFENYSFRANTYFKIVKFPSDCKRNPDQYLNVGDHVQISRKGGIYTHDAIYVGGKEAGKKQTNKGQQEDNIHRNSQPRKGSNRSTKKQNEKRFKGKKQSRNNKAVPFYRLYNARHKDHFYTTSKSEADSAAHSWKLETNYLIFNVRQPNTVPLYRYWNPQIVDHFYSTKANEIGTTTHGQTGNNGYVSEGIAGYCYEFIQHGSAPLYRLYHHGVGDHFYTTSSAEAFGPNGYSFERIECHLPLH